MICFPNRKLRPSKSPDIRRPGTNSSLTMSNWKGKARALPRADGDDSGGTTAGVVIPLDVVGSGVYDVYAHLFLPRFSDLLLTIILFFTSVRTPSR